MAVQKDTGKKNAASERAAEVDSLPLGEALDRLESLQNELFGDKALTGDSVDFIREAREERASS